jgi:predicted lysophospholipase L1 biosynthesis ABC-type transport system permease subunit
VQHLRDDGVEVRSSHDATKVFDNNNHHALGWSYAPLAALGVLFAAAALAVQLLVDQARRTTRQAAHVIMRRRGFGALALFRASLVEIGVPTLAGALFGVPLGVLGASIAVRHLDPIPDVPPPAITVLPWPTIGVLVAVLVVVDLLVAASIVRTTVRADPMEVLRGAP